MAPGTGMDVGVLPSFPCSVPAALECHAEPQWQRERRHSSAAVPLRLSLGTPSTGNTGRHLQEELRGGKRCCASPLWHHCTLMMHCSRASSCERPLEGQQREGRRVGQGSGEGPQQALLHFVRNPLTLHQGVQQRRNAARAQ